MHRAWKRTRRVGPDPPELLEQRLESRAIVAAIHEHGAERVAHVRLALDANPGERANRIGDAAGSHREAGGAEGAGKDDDVGQKRLGHERARYGWSAATRALASPMMERRRAPRIDSMSS